MTCGEEIKIARADNITLFIGHILPVRYMRRYDLCRACYAAYFTEFRRALVARGLAVNFIDPADRERMGMDEPRGTE